MGLKDRLMKKYMPDYTALFTEALGEDDTYIGYANGYPSAYERASRSRGIEQVILHKVVDGISNKVAQNRHVGGDDDSIAAQFPLVASLEFLVLSRKGLSKFDCGMDGRDAPDLQLQVKREAIESIAATGKKARGGAQMYRFSFTDGSFIDYEMVYLDDRFQQAITELGG